MRKVTKPKNKLFLFRHVYILGDLKINQQKKETPFVFGIVWISE